MNSARGFTLVELVAVLIIASIIGSVVVPRFSNTASFDETLAHDQLISLARSAQQLSLARANVDLFFQDTGSELSVATRVGGTVQTSRIFPKNEVTITADTSAAGGTQGTCTAIGTPISVSFDASGELAGAYPSGTYSQGFPICLNGSSVSLCISPSGFAHSGSCV
jgi:MSHA pilin protein MshC